MKPILSFFILWMLSFSGFSQDWMGIVPSKKTYFADRGGLSIYGEGVNRLGVEDSVIGVGYKKYKFTKSWFYNYYFNVDPFYINSNGIPASILGNEYIHTNLGIDTMFDRDSIPIVIHTMANLNDEWVFYKIDSTRYYTAKVVAMDTMRINSTIDSIKTISITYWLSGVPQSLNIPGIILSKQHGFIEIQSPFHSFSSTFFDQSTFYFCDSSHVVYKPLMQEYEKFQVGNEWIESSGGCDGWGTWPMDWCNQPYYHYYYWHDSVISVIPMINDTLQVSLQRKDFLTQQVSTISFKIHTPSNSMPSFAMVDTMQAYHLPAIFRLDSCANLNITQSFIKSGFESRWDSSWTWQEGLGINLMHFRRSGSAPDYRFTYFSTEYLKINGCSLGFKQTVLSAQEFKLSLISNPNGNTLHWTTRAEYGVSHFEVERSTDATHYERIGNSASNGDQIALNEYEFDDKSLNQKGSVFYYRIKMVDRDGKFVYSNVVSSKNPEVTQAIEVYPTLVENICILYNLNPDLTYAVRLIDLMGNVLSKNHITNLTQYNVPNLGTLHKGQYLIQIIQGESGIREVFRFTKL